ncbi:MAG: hypothetical protein EOP50_13715 [Sphingobacteriales bacterium]|nr:MAG: hypothetical protein EOP50_13715 [Sphingobacteriales bacterium]
MQVNYWWEFILMIVVCSPLLFIAYKMKQQGSDVVRNSIQPEIDRHKAIKRLYEERQEDD